MSSNSMAHSSTQLGTKLAFLQSRPCFQSKWNKKYENRGFKSRSPRLCKNAQHLMSSVVECLQSAVKREGDATDVKYGTVAAFPRCVAGIKF